MKLLKLDGTELINGDYKTIKDLLIKNKNADLRGADLTGADLRDAYLTGADLRDAYLTGAYLTGAYLRDAYLTGAYLTGAYLTGAYLTGADLTGADLRGADLTGAYLTGADLTGADLTGADLTGAYLRGAKYGEIEIKNTIIYIANLDYNCLIFSGHIKLGCKFYNVEEWEKFTDDEIIQMDGKKAIKFWKQWKDVLITMCKKEMEV